MTAMVDRNGPTGSVTVRKPEPRDVDALLPIKNDPEIAALLAGTTRAWSRDDLMRWVEHHRSAPDEAFFVVADGHDQAIGHVALYRIDPGAGTAEFGILLGDRAIWGQGVGTQVTRFAIEYGFDVLGLRRIYLEVVDTNERARHVYEKLGFVVEGRLREHQVKHGRHVDVIVMGLLRDDYRRAPEAASPAGSTLR